MATPSSPIPRCVAGQNSLVSADYANKIIDPLNAVLQARVAPIANVGAFNWAGKGQFILDLGPLASRVTVLEQRGAGSGLPTGGNVGDVLVLDAGGNAVWSGYFTQQLQNIIFSLQAISNALSACECEPPEPCCEESGVPGCCDAPNPPECCEGDCNPCVGIGDFTPVPPNDCGYGEGCLCIGEFPQCF